MDLSWFRDHPLITLLIVFIFLLLSSVAIGMGISLAWEMLYQVVVFTVGVMITAWYLNIDRPVRKKIK